MPSASRLELNGGGYAPAKRGQPVWDAFRRELRLRGLTVKRYRVHAQNQELVLAVFQELGWPACIDDPLPQGGDIDPKERLQATIKSLNRCQRTPRIRFHGNGTACQICWEIIPPRPRRQRR
jgi:hypothetical protein